MINKIPDGYRQKLSIYDTQRAIEFIKHIFQHYMKTKMNLKRVTDMKDLFPLISLI